MNGQASTNPSRKTPWSFLETPWWPKLQKFIFLLAIVMAVVLLVNSIVWKTDYLDKLIRLACGLGGVIVVAGVKKILGNVTDELKTKIFKGALIYTAVVGGFLVLSLNSGYIPTGGDNAVCFQAAEGEGGGVTYQLKMAHQDPFIFLIRCFNHFLGARNYIAFFVLNLGSLLVIVACAGKISDLIFKDNKTTAIALLLTASFSPIFLHLPTIIGNIPGLACFLSAIYFWLSRRRGWILACVLASILAVLFKATFSAFLLFWVFWGAVASLQKGCFARYLVIPLLCFLASSFAQTQFIRSYEEYHK
ncbi:MAG: hypothetical protein LBG65_00005, partial [Puniceicoccales bacterium]|nr:hypothetical protein [Puniceicoccales bacterium]